MMFGLCCCTNDDDKGLSVEPLRDALSMAQGEDEVVPAWEDQQPSFLDQIVPKGSVEPVVPPINSAGAVHPQQLEGLGFGDTLPSVGMEFTITLEKQTAETPVGVDLETLGSLAMIWTIHDGPVKLYNANAPPDLQVQHGDYIVRVDGKKGTMSELISAFSQSRVVQVTLHRPKEITVTLDKRKYNGEVGLELDYMASGTTLLIKQIKHGPVEAWNENNRFHTVIAGDRIVAVNGRQMDAEGLLEICRNNMDLELKIVRPSP